MADVGPTVTDDLLNELAKNLAQQFARTSQDAILLATYVDEVGVPGLQQAGFGTEDAQMYQQGVDYLKTVALIFQGGAIDPSPFNFGQALAQFIGPATTI